MNSDQELKGYRFIERSLPARINMKCIAGPEATGTMCCGCEEIVDHVFAACKCPEWIEANARMMAKLSEGMHDEEESRI